MSTDNCRLSGDAAGTVTPLPRGYDRTEGRTVQEVVATRDSVLSEVAHDLRSPLSVVMMAADLLLQEDMSDIERVQRVTLIRRSAERMNRLIQDLLDVVRLQSGHMLLECYPLSVSGLMDEVDETERPQAVAKHQEFRITLPVPDFELCADRERLIRVLDNLIGNAIKFTQSGGHISVDVTMRDGEVVFTVADDGPGMDAETLKMLFEKFWQREPSTTHGLGLGLTISKDIVEAHGGRIWASSGNGKGTTVHFTIPMEGCDHA
jgi:signal transduction histidine kinase